VSDLSDVQDALASQIEATVYPDGTASPSIVGLTVKIYPGWPDPDVLQADLAPQGSPPAPAALHVSIFSTPAERDTTRFPDRERATVTPFASYTMTQGGQTITVGGAAPGQFSPQNLAAFINGIPYSLTTSPGQTAAQIAAALQALIVVGVPGTSVAGPVITLPAGARIGALRVGVTATTGKPVRQTEKVFQIGVWTDTPAHRAALAAPIDAALAGLTFLQVPDGFAARIRRKSSLEIDNDQKQGIYRRDLFYSVEYSLTEPGQAAEIVAMQINVDDQFGDPIETSYA